MSAFKGTPGPWAWEVTPSGEIRLQTPDRGKLYVMGFARKGMRGAQPRFSLWGDGLRERRGGIMHDFIEAGGPEHPDARLIATAPDLLEAAEALRSFEYRRGDLIHQAALGPKCKCAKCIEERADAAIAKATGAQP